MEELSTMARPLCRKRKLPQRVKFTTTKTYLFDVAYGGSALPSESGPPIGLASKHHDVILDTIDPNSEIRIGTTRKFDHSERIELLKAASYSVKEIAEFCFEAIDLRQSRLKSIDEVNIKRKRRSSFDTSYSKRFCIDGNSSCSDDED